jgi:hypothetical protein
MCPNNILESAGFRSVEEINMLYLPANPRTTSFTIML